MKFKFDMPTKIFFESDCVQNNSNLFRKLGKKAMIVTGKHSAKACGALEDVTEVLEKNEIKYIVFDRIENNPSVETIQEACEILQGQGVEFIIGIGGGSPLDASKAIGVLAAHSDMKVLDLFLNRFTKSLPVVEIPTTAGTGSEVTPYSVLLRKDIQTKVSFGNECTYPAYALLDAKYIKSLSKNALISTAIDAFTHVFEGYLANRSTVISDSLALLAISTFGNLVRKLGKSELNDSELEDLMLTSLLGGIVISQTGVTIAHGMGYCYTYFKEIPHGKANGLIMKEYIQLNYEYAKSKIDRTMEALGCSNVNEFNEILQDLLGDAPELTDDEIEQYTELTMIQKGSISNTPYPLNKDEIRRLWIRQANIAK